MNVNLKSNTIEVEVCWFLLPSSLYFRSTRCGSTQHFSFYSLYFKCCRVNVTASCWASRALVSWIGSQRGGGGTMSQSPRASSDSCCAPPCCGSGLTGLRGHLHWMGFNTENVGSGSHSAASSRKNRGARRVVYLGQIWISHTLMHTYANTSSGDGGDWSLQAFGYVDG